MYWLRRFWLLFPWNRRVRERELGEELRANLALAVEEAEDSAAGPNLDAARLARRDFGNLTLAQENARAVWLPGSVGLAQDLRFAIRGLRRSPAFTTVAILSLALGIAAAATLFSLVDAVVLKPLAYRDPGRLLFIREVVKPLEHVYPTLPVNYQHFRFWRENAHSFESIAALDSGSAVMTGRDEPENLAVGFVSANFFETLGVEPQLGRSFRPEEEQPNSPGGIVITDGLWRRRFATSPSILGEKVVLASHPFQIVGVLPPDFRFPKNNDLGPLARLAERTDAFLPVQSYAQGWGGDYDYMVFGRLRPGVTESQGGTELNLLERRIVEDHRLDPADGLRVETESLQDVIASPVRASLTVLLSAVLVLVLIVCVNLANLLLARGSARAREYAMRIALGASRGRLVVSALIETLLLSLVGGIFGTVGTMTAVSAFARLAPIDLPRADEARVDGPVVAFVFGLALVCALLFGLLPALRSSRADPQSALRSESQSATAGRGGLHLREWLVGGEVALSTLLLILAALLVSSLRHVLDVDRGFATEHTLIVSPTVPATYRPAEVGAFFDRAVNTLRALPGVRSADAVNRPPLAGESSVNDVSIDGSKEPALEAGSRQLVEVNDRFVSDEYFLTAGIPLLRGRGFEPADRDRNVAVISARLAAKLFPSRDPVGHSVSSGSRIADARIVGVVGDVFTSTLEGNPTPMIYVPFWKSGNVSDLLVHCTGDPITMEPIIRRAIQSIDSGVPAPKMRTMQEMVDRSVAPRRFQMELAGSFGIAALLLAALGIYGVVTYGVALRRRELGVRVALGARAAAVRSLVLRRGLRPVIAGLFAGLVAALAAGHLVRSLLFGIAPTDPWTLVGATGLLAGVALAACLLPAHRAATIDPARILRDE
jgi:predicted permease